MFKAFGWEGLLFSSVYTVDNILYKYQPIWIRDDSLKLR